MNWMRTSAVAQILLAGYWALIMCVPLDAWNRQPGFESLLEALWKRELDTGGVLFVIIFLLPSILFLLGYRKGIRWLVLFAIVFDAVWFGLQVWSWWVPYIFGASPQWQRTYERTFSHTINFLPTFGKHLAPDAMHTVLQILLLLAIVTGSMGFIRAQVEPNSAVVHQRTDGKP